MQVYTLRLLGSEPVPQKQKGGGGHTNNNTS